MDTLQFNIGANVQCSDGTCGTLSKVVVAPDSDRVEEIVVDVEGGLLEPTRRYVVSVEDVERATDQGVQLAISSDVLREQGDYAEKEVEKPRSSWHGEEEHRVRLRTFWTGRYGVKAGAPGVPARQITVQKGVPEEDVVVGRGTPVRHRIEELGTVDHVLANPDTGEITHIVIQQKATLGHYVVIPDTMIKEITGNGVSVEVSGEALVELPRYTPRDEAEIQAELEERFWIEETDYDLSNVDLEVEDGVVYLTGTVLDPAAKRYADALAFSTEGVIDVENDLIVGKET